MPRSASAGWGFFNALYQQCIMTFYSKSPEQLAQCRGLVDELFGLIDLDGRPDMIEFLCEILTSVISAQEYELTRRESETEKASDSSTPQLTAVS